MKHRSIRLLTVLALIAAASMAQARVFVDEPLPQVLKTIERLSQGHPAINFAYDDLAGLSVTADIGSAKGAEAVRRAVADLPVSVESGANHVTVARRRATLSGRVVDEEGRPVGHASLVATNVARPNRVVATNADSDGRFSLNLPLTSDFTIVIECLGHSPATLTSGPGNVGNITLERRPTRLSDVVVNDSSTVSLGEVTVNVDAIRNLHSTRPGMTVVGSGALLSTPTLLGEADLVKTLQQEAGVSNGVEGFAGLYVHGGNDDQNLFVYDGLPLYHVSHLAGMFSAFNASAVDRVSFYKASFPPRFGGRVSSIVDIASRRSDFERFTGRVSVGLLSGSAWLTGPIIPGKTAFSVSLRRSWVDLLSAPTLAIVNAARKKDGKKTIASYAFTDATLRLDHSFSHTLQGRVTAYYGHDRLKIGDRTFQTAGEEYERHDEESNTLSWGNVGVSAAIDLRLGVGLLNATAYYTHYGSTFRQESDWAFDNADGRMWGLSKSRTRNTVNDLGISAMWQASLGTLYAIEAGATYIRHNFLPEDLRNMFVNQKDTLTSGNTSARVHADETAVWVDNTLTFGDRAALSAGIRLSTYTTGGRTHVNPEPRASLRVNLTRNLSVKASYSRTVQYVQQPANNAVTLPTDLWQPVVDGLDPLTADQLAGGFYGNVGEGMYFSAEGWWKKLHNVWEYRQGISALSARAEWFDKLTQGEGRAYGVDLSFTRAIGRVTGTASYGLMWNTRRFADLNGGREFPAKFDNRHKVNISATWALNSAIEFTAAWHYITGNRVTLSLYDYTASNEADIQAPGAGLVSGLTAERIDYYPGINNVRIPANHRLDVSMTYTRPLKKGRRIVWSFGIYNLYCRRNPVTIKKDIVWENNETRRCFRALSFLPIIPSASFTYEF